MPGRYEFILWWWTFIFRICLISKLFFVRLFDVPGAFWDDLLTLEPRMFVFAPTGVLLPRASATLEVWLPVILRLEDT